MKSIIAVSVALLVCPLCAPAQNAADKQPVEKTDSIVAYKSLPVGTMAPEFTLSDVNGKEVSLSSCKGKYVVLDFWASWCKDCVHDIPEIKEIYERYKSRPDFELIGVSLDRTRDAWANRIDKDSLSWPQVFADGGWNGPVARQYDIHWIPTTYLVGPDGNIVSVTFNAEDLATKLKEILPTE